MSPVVRHFLSLPTRLLAAGFLILGLSARPAAATPITYVYGGTITSADASTGIAPGTHFEGTFTYDPATKPFYLAIEGEKVYTFGIPPSTGSDTSNLTLHVGGQSSFNGAQLGVTLSDQSAAVYPPAPGGAAYLGPTSTYWNMSAHNNLVNVALDFANPNLSLNPSLSLTHLYSMGDFPIAHLSVTDGANHTGAILYSGTIDSLSALPVPEPTTFAVLAVAVVGLAARRHIRRNR